MRYMKIAKSNNEIFIEKNNTMKTTIYKNTKNNGIYNVKKNYILFLWFDGVSSDKLEKKKEYKTGVPSGSSNSEKKEGKPRRAHYPTRCSPNKKANLQSRGLEHKPAVSICNRQLSSSVRRNSSVLLFAKSIYLWISFSTSKEDIKHS
jgi:hypothetical protein